MNIPCFAIMLFAAGCQQTGSHSSNALFSSQQKSDTLAHDSAADMQLAFAKTFERNGETQKAIDAYERLADRKDIPQAMHRLGVLHDQQGNYDKASAYYRKALKHRPNDADLLCDVGYSYYLQENWKASESHLRRAVKIKPKMERAHNNLGLLFARMNQRDAALAAFRSGTSDNDVALTNFNYVFAEKKNSASAPIAGEAHAPSVQLADIQPNLLKTEMSSTEQVSLSSLSATTGLSQRVDYELPPAHPSLIASEDIVIEPVELADFSQTQSNSGSSKIESVDHAEPSHVIPRAIAR